ncbi:ATP-dependent metallopeptidase FtsH/Yme1/Tma family protein [Sebaldella sp. S0638]|uniref:ATP-dependent metallopeptidase FtsH/Yme1/Tma family protein n=1 Tax=Sebaldella sp. S0638 TaxID=2957809 RepID=UPI0020A12A97|nr:ATP-dependent metallopeptidase FtsH/Yme1/Tma family protein [Sebaldella sp. S0638]MCP1224877.1 ATP-dependent metallopeptidase FtsH/Yme1/Tma family protein [Sebaldella sp. S0638]
MQKNKNKKSSYSKPLFAGVVIIILILTVIFIISNHANTSGNTERTISYDDFVSKIESGQTKEVKEKDEFIMTVIKEDNSDVIYKAEKITDRVGEDSNLMGIIETQNINLQVQQPRGPNYFWPLVFNLLPFFILLGIFIAGITVIVIIVVCSLDRSRK